MAWRSIHVSYSGHSFAEPLAYTFRLTAAAVPPSTSSGRNRKGLLSIALVVQW